MVSQIEAQPMEYQDLLTSINNLDEENEPFTYDKPGWSVMEQEPPDNNPWFLVLINLHNALKTGNFSYDEKRILLDEFKKQFETKTKCGERSIERAEERKPPRKMANGTDLCDYIGWNINGLAEQYTPIELLNNKLNKLKKEDIGKALAQNSWHKLWLKIIHKINSFPTKLKKDENLKNLVLKFKERFEETNCNKDKEGTACYLINKGLDKLWKKYKDDLIFEVPPLIELAARKIPAQDFEAVSSEMMLDARAAEARKGGKKRKSKRKKGKKLKRKNKRKTKKKYNKYIYINA